MIEAWIVANQRDLVNVADDRLFHSREDAEFFRRNLNAVSPGPWKVYKIRVEFVGTK